MQLDTIKWNFSGKGTIVTGGSRGIGRAVVRLLVESGASVVVTGRSQASLDELAKSADADRIVAVRGSVTDEGHCEEVVNACVESFGRLDILVNNAGINPEVGPLQAMSLAAFDKTVAANMRAPLEFVQAAWNAWMSSHGGAIINVSSISSMRSLPTLGAYSVSKAALNHLTRQLAVDMAPGVRVNAVAPGVVVTDFARSLYEGDADPAARYPLRRLGQPEDIAHLVAFLVSDASSWITGQVIVADAGASLLLSG